MTEDYKLLKQYTSQGTRQALDELIRRHRDLVYSSALRQTRNSHLAEDVTQAVFLILAQRAWKIRDGVAVAGWLLAVTRTTAVDAMRKRTLDRRYEEAKAKPELAPSAAAPWDEIAPVLDAALSQLKQHDRDAVVLRVLENQSLSQVGAELGISQEAAKKRVSRALLRLRHLLSRQGVWTGAVALSAALGARAVHAAPAHLSAATLAGSASASVAALARGSLRAMAWSTAKLAASTALALLLLTFLGAASFGYLFPPRKSNAVMSPVAAPAPPIAALGVPSAAIPAAFNTEDRFAGSNDTRFGQLANGATRVLGMTSDTAGNIYAFGDTFDESLRIHGIVRQKTSGQSDWTTILDLPNKPFTALMVDSAGDVYLGDRNWTIFERLAGQPEFSASSIDPRNPPRLIHPGSLPVRTGICGFVTDAHGNLYVAGECSSGSGFDGWIVRKRAHGADDFITVDNITQDATPISITVVNKGVSAGVYVVGFITKRLGTDSDGASLWQVRWVVRKSADDGNTWATVDDFVADDSIRNGVNRANAVCADPAGNVYVAGFVSRRVLIASGSSEDAKDKLMDAIGQHWITRRSSTGNINSWKVDDDFTLSAIHPHSIPHAIGIDHAGNVYVAGVAQGDIAVELVSGPGIIARQPAMDVPNAGHAIIRTNAGGAWHTVEDYQPVSSSAEQVAAIEYTAKRRSFVAPDGVRYDVNESPENAADFRALAVDSNGRLYAGGLIYIHGANPDWLIRSALPIGPTTPLKTPSSFQTKETISRR